MPPLPYGFHRSSRQRPAPAHHVEILHTTVLGKDGMEAHGAFKAFVPGNGGVLRLDTLDKFSDGDTCACLNPGNLRFAFQRASSPPQGSGEQARARAH